MLLKLIINAVLQLDYYVSVVNPHGIICMLLTMVVYLIIMLIFMYLLLQKINMLKKNETYFN